MEKYKVDLVLYVGGYTQVEIEAEDEDSAIDTAIEYVHNHPETWNLENDNLDIEIVNMVRIDEDV
jgi:hypothetical protein